MTSKSPYDLQISPIGQNRLQNASYTTPNDLQISKIHQNRLQNASYTTPNDLQISTIHQNRLQNASYTTPNDLQISPIGPNRLQNASYTTPNDLQITKIDPNWPKPAPECIVYTSQKGDKKVQKPLVLSQKCSKKIQKAQVFCTFWDQKCTKQFFLAQRNTDGRTDGRPIHLYYQKWRFAQHPPQKKNYGRNYLTSKVLCLIVRNKILISYN